MAAREVAVAALGTVYAVADAESATSLLGATLAAQWSLATGLAFLAWYVFAPQCLPTIGVVRRETGSMKWTLIIAAFIPNRTVWGFANQQGLVMFGLYATGILSALAVSFVIRRIFWRGAVEPFMMELPAYKTPDLRSVIFNLWIRARIFLERAGRIILPLMVLIWALSTFPYPPEGATAPAIDYSFAGMIGKALEPVFAPIGFNWQMVIALIPGMAAREVAVAALGTVYAVADPETATAVLATTLAGQWSLATGLAFLAWYIFAPQCVATLGVVKRETNSWKWMWVMVAYMFALAYLAAFVTYRVAVTLGGG
jgi:ferrous iron transport protein B